jgi:hypothetical protein
LRQFQLQIARHSCPAGKSPAFSQFRVDQLLSIFFGNRQVAAYNFNAAPLATAAAAARKFHAVSEQQILKGRATGHGE